MCFVFYFLQKVKGKIKNERSIYQTSRFENIDFFHRLHKTPKCDWGLVGPHTLILFTWPWHMAIASPYMAMAPQCRHSTLIWPWHKAIAYDYTDYQ